MVRFLERVHRLLTPAYWDAIHTIAEYEGDRVFCRHPFQHFLDVARIAYILLLEQGTQALLDTTCAATLAGAKEMVYGAGLLHDIGRAAAYRQGGDHALLGAAMARPLLADAGFGPTEVELIATAIAEHRGRTAAPTALGLVLHRADRLSRSCHQCQVINDCFKREEIMATGWHRLQY